MTEPVQYEFYRPWPLFGKMMSTQWGESRQNTEVLAALVQAAGLDLDTPLGNSDLMSWELGQHNFHNRFRFIYDDVGTALRIQKNTGTEGLPVWVDVLIIDYETSSVSVPGSFSSGFYLGLDRVALSGLHQLQPSEFYHVTELLFSSDDGFYFTRARNGSPVVRLSDRVRGGSGSAGISSIAVRSTVSSPTFNTDTIIFDKANFYLSPNSAGKPVVSLNNTGTSTGISSITVKTTKTPPPTFSTSTLIFDRSDFYLSSNSSGLPIVSLAAEDVDTNTTALTVKTTNPTPTFSTDTLIFDRSNFYISSNSSGKPVVSFTPSPSTPSGAGNTSIVSGVQSQTFSSSVEWQFNHNLNSRPLLWSIYNTNFEAILPDKLDISNANTAYFYFVNPLAGTAIVSSGRTSVDLTGGFYGISVRNNPRTESFKNINLISFDSADFYLTQNATNRDEVLIGLKAQQSSFVKKAGDTMTGSLEMRTAAQFQGGTEQSTSIAVFPQYGFNNTTFVQGSSSGMGYREPFGIPFLEFFAQGFALMTFIPSILPNAPFVSIDTISGVGCGLTNVRYLTFKELTTTQRDALTPVEGMVIYNTTTNVLNFYNGVAWGAV